ncbi:helix-turn-helix transcriptional regulator [Lactiplantibacillus pentosus]|nr:helix-turn-helix transcriptional regulator [Lactiplantibacillus pentosus]
MVMILGKHIKEERKKRNLKQDQLSQTLNVSRQVISE